MIFVLNIVVILFMILWIIANNFYKHISFGWGLGDILVHWLYNLLSIIYLVLLVFRDQFNTQLEYTLISFVVVNVIFTYFATYGRGNEYKWNGSIFYK